MTIERRLSEALDTQDPSEATAFSLVDKAASLADLAAFRMVSPAARRCTCAGANQMDLPLDASNIPSGSLLSWTSAAACVSAASRSLEQLAL